MKAPALDDRIRAALADQKTPSHVLSALIADVRTAHEEAERTYSRSRKEALTPTTPRDRVVAARADMNDAQFELERLTAAALEIETRMEAAKAAERVAHAATERAAALAERDTLAAEFRDRYPELAGELALLLARLLLSEERLKAAGITASHELTEAVARRLKGQGGAATMGVDIPRLTESRLLQLPSLDDPHVLLWPPIAEGVGVPRATVLRERGITTATRWQGAGK